MTGSDLLGIAIIAILAIGAVASKWVPRPAPPTGVPTDAVAPSDKLASVIFTYNATKPYFAISDSWSVPAKGVIIHKITQAQANEISTAVQAAATKYGLPLTYALACLAVESVLDPNCVNGNLGPGESNTANDPLGYDDGIAQLKLRYLVGAAPGVTDSASAYLFAKDVNRAAPYFCSLMAGHFAAAKEILAKDTSSAPDVRLRNPWVYATGSYNFGETGMAKVFASGEYPSHCTSVVSDEQYFAAKLGLPSIFADLPK